MQEHKDVAPNFEMLLDLASDYGKRWSQEGGQRGEEGAKSAPTPVLVDAGESKNAIGEVDQTLEPPISTGRARIKAGNLNPKRIKQSKIRSAQSRAAADAMTDSAPAICPSCQGEMRMQEFETKCTVCGLVVEGDTTAVDMTFPFSQASKPMSSRLRIVGSNSALFQSDLDRSTVSDSAVASQQQILLELKTRRDRHKERGGRLFPLNVIQGAADHYSQVQKLVCKRSNNKSTILGACLRYACLEKNFVPRKSEIANFMGLKVAGIARGDNYIRMLHAEKHVDINVNRDMVDPSIMTAFTQLGLEDSAYDKLRDIVSKVVKRAVERHVGTSSIIGSKVIGATYIVLQRFMRAGNKLPLTDSGGGQRYQSLTTQGICKICQIRRSTLDRFLKEINVDFHSQFEDIYKEAGIFSGRFDSAPNKKPRKEDHEKGTKEEKKEI